MTEILIWCAMFFGSGFVGGFVGVVAGVFALRTLKWCRQDRPAVLYRTEHPYDIGDMK